MRYFFITVYCLVMIINLRGFAVAEDHRYAAIVLDDATGKVLHAENAYDRRHPASMVKKMTLYLLFEALRAKKITLQTRFSTSSLAAKQIPCKLGLQVGQTISVEDIIKGMVTKSANDAAVVIAEGLAGSLANFVALMNKKAKKLGMNSTRFYNASGVPDARQITTAMDMAILGRALYHHFPDYYPYFKTKHFQYKGSSHRNHNQLLGKFEGLDGIKTGFVNASGFNISTSAVRYDKSRRPRRLFAVVMGGQSWRSRDKKIAELLEDGFYKIGALTGDKSNLLPLPSSKVQVKDVGKLQSVAYNRRQQQALIQTVTQKDTVSSPQYPFNDVQLLETSLKSSPSAVKPRTALLVLPNIIEPIATSAPPHRKKNKNQVISVSQTLDDQRALPPGWMVPTAPVPVKKKLSAAVRLKKAAN